MANLLKHIIYSTKLIFHLNKANIKQRFTLVEDFWVAILAIILEQCIAIAFLEIIFFRIKAIKGWNHYEMVFLLSLFILSKPMYRILLQGVIKIPRMILTGSLDHMLIRPCNPLILILANASNPAAFGDIILGSVLMYYSLSNLEITISVAYVLFFILISFCGSLIYVGTYLIRGIFCIFFTRFDSFIVIMQQFQQYAKYPIKIYHPIIKVILITILPFGLAASVPAGLFLNKFGIPTYFWFVPFLCLFYFCITAFLFNKSLKYYKSTGS